MQIVSEFGALRRLGKTRDKSASFELIKMKDILYKLNT